MFLGNTSLSNTACLSQLLPNSCSPSTFPGQESDLSLHFSDPPRSGSGVSLLHCPITESIPGASRVLALESFSRWVVGAAHPGPWTGSGMGNRPITSRGIQPTTPLQRNCSSNLLKSSFYPVLCLWSCWGSTYHDPGSLHFLCEFLQEACLFGRPASYLPWSPGN